MKKGRPAKPYRTTWGETVDGLYRLPAGRWRITATGERFTQHDERLAVLRFRQTLAKREGKHGDFHVPLAAPEAAKIIRRHGSSTPGHVTIVEQFPTVHRIDSDNPSDPVTLLKRVPEPLLFDWMKRTLIDRPKYAAEQTGIEQLGYLADLPKPTPSPTLDEVGDLYFSKSKVTGHWLTKSRLFWTEFCDSVGVKTLREVTQELVAEYKGDVLDAPPSPTYVKHRFGQVKCIINYGKEWGKWADDRSRALAYCTILIPPENVGMDPDPIDPADFHKLLAAADDQAQAILLLALNACMYGHEVAPVAWDSLDLDKGVLVDDRSKTGVARVAVLWPRTVEALAKLPRLTDQVFITEATKQVHNGNTVRKLFRDLRTAAGVSAEVKFRQVRDGAYTSACEGKGVQYEHARILGGHRIGMSDHYVKRRPQIVADACEAVRLAYGL